MEQWASQPADPAVARPTTASASSAPSSSRPPAGSGRSGTARTSRCSTSTATGSCRATAEWESRWWSPIINAEHLAMRDRAGHGRPVGVRDLRRHRARARSPPSSGWRSTRSTSRSGGPSTRRCSTRPAGSSPTSRSCGSAHDRFRVVTGGGMGMRDKKLFADGLPADGSAQLHDATNACTTFGLWGPRARDILGAASTARRRQPRGLPVPDRRRRSTSTASGRWPRGSATSASSAGRSTSRSSRASGSGTRSGRPASRTASSPVGIGTYAVTARLEKGYRAHGAELELDFDLVEAGMARPTRQGRRLRRPGGVPRGSARSRRSRSCAP